MDDRTSAIERFFAGYAAEFARALAGHGNAEATAAHFADCFVEAGPQGVSCGQNDEVFRQMIPRGYESYRSIGMEAMSIQSMEITHLDELHSVARVRWLSTYRSKDESEESIDFQVVYLVQTLSEVPRIFAYIVGDEQAAMRDKGLIGTRMPQPSLHLPPQAVQRR
ncbi:MAG: hypothetical protein GXX83_10610 [Gaiellales bacterium]|nr:hypothetical protein [Gaiellales bacterium]